MIKPIVIGIDTSNYTTSVGVVDLDGNLIANKRKLLPVGKGECGLRQSEAVFAHLKNIPEIMAELRLATSSMTPIAVGVSITPRKQAGSYMPCFLSGNAIAEGIAASFGLPLYKFSHQCGHIMAALYTCGDSSIMNREFAAFHVSGGTTELLRVQPIAHSGFDAELVGETMDLNAGQVIDRVGVSLGLGFPCGNELDALASTYRGKVPKKKPSIKGLNISLSGLENMAKRMYEETSDAPMVAAFVFNYIADAISAMTDAYIDKYGNMPIVYAGGVMRNSIIRNKLSEKYDAYFAQPDMSSDNAVGTAMLALNAYKSNL